MSFGQDEDGRRVFLSVDSRAIARNPLYRAFKTKSFTDRDNTLHFHLLDLLNSGAGLSITQVMDLLTVRLSYFASGELPDESTVRRMLKEYTALGRLTAGKGGRERARSRCGKVRMTEPGLQSQRQKRIISLSGRTPILKGGQLWLKRHFTPPAAPSTTGQML